jgi:hypothetical protein
MDYPSRKLQNRLLTKVGGSKKAFIELGKVLDPVVLQQNEEIAF